MTQERRGERRRQTRVRVEGEVTGRIHTVQAAPVIDISETGAMLEVPCTLRPGSLYVLRLPLGGEIVLRSRVVRCYVVGQAKLGNGEMVLTYRAAVEFVDVGAREREVIHRQIEARYGAVGAAAEEVS